MASALLAACRKAILKGSGGRRKRFRAHRVPYGRRINRPCQFPLYQTTAFVLHFRGPVVSGRTLDV